MLLQWPGEIAEGNGKQQMIIDERADPAQREALRQDPARREHDAGRDGVLRLQQHDVARSSTRSTRRSSSRSTSTRGTRACACRAWSSPTARRSSTRTAAPQHRSQIRLPEGFEYTVAEVGKGTSRARAAIELTLDGTHGQFHTLHMNQDGVIR